MKNLNLWAWVFSLGITALFCYFMGRGSVKPKVVTITVQDTTTTTIFLPETVIVCDFDTVFIDSTTLFIDIPDRDTMFKDEITLKVNGDIVYIPTEERLSYKGLLKQRSLRILPVTYTATSQSATACRSKWLKGYGSLAFALNTKKRPLSEIEMGVIFGNRLAVFGRVMADDTLAVTPMVGLKVCF